MDTSRLRDLMDQRRLTYGQVAELSGVVDETVGRIVRGTTANPSVDTLARIANGLGVTVGWILGEKGFEFSENDRLQLRRFLDWGEAILKATQPEKKELERPNVSVVSLGRKPPPPSSRRGRATPVSATDWRESFGDRREEREVDIPQQFAARGATHVFRAEGESMIGDHIANGDLLYVAEEADPRRAWGCIVVCVVGGSPSVKRLEATSVSSTRTKSSRRWCSTNTTSTGAWSASWSAGRTMLDEYLGSRPRPRSSSPVRVQLLGMENRAGSGPPLVEHVRQRSPVRRRRHASAEARRVDISRSAAARRDASLQRSRR
jgi:transcriptional regulator with XRE-family HTH domain